MDIFLAFDGGQSHSLALVADEQGVILSLELAGPCNHFDEPGGKERFRRTLINTTQRALELAGFTQQNKIAGACYGLTGYWERAGAILSPIFSFETLAAVEDVETAQAAAFGGGAGIVLIAGTGAVSYGLTADQRTARSGGWGYLMADEGSAYDIGRQALQVVAQAYDGRGEPTSLLPHLLNHFRQDDFLSLHRFIYQGPIPRHEIAHLAKLVSRAAAEGDEVARGIMDKAAYELARHVVAVARKLDWQDPPVSPIGGVFRAKEIILPPLQHHLDHLLPEAKLQMAKFPQVIGALLIAYRLRGYPISETLLERLSEEAMRHRLWEYG